LPYVIINIIDENTQIDGFEDLIYVKSITERATCILELDLNTPYNTECENGPDGSEDIYYRFCDEAVLESMELTDTTIT